jgi:hypothetical protein
VQRKSYEVYVEVGSYAGGGTSGAFLTSTDMCFKALIQAVGPQQAQRIAQAQYGGPDKCRVGAACEV